MGRGQGVANAACQSTPSKGTIDSPAIAKRTAAKTGSVKVSFSEKGLAAAITAMALQCRERTMPQTWSHPPTRKEAGTYDTAFDMLGVATGYKLVLAPIIDLASADPNNCRTTLEDLFNEIAASLGEKEACVKRTFTLKATGSRDEQSRLSCLLEALQADTNPTSVELNTIISSAAGGLTEERAPALAAHPLEKPLIAAANTLVHSGDYGQLWLNVKTTDVRWIAGDADDEEDGCSSAKEIRHALKIPGVRRVDVLVEYGVPESASWVYLAHAAKTLARPSYPA